MLLLFLGYSFTTCSYNTGPNGPWKEDCLNYYDYNGGNSTKVDMYSYNEYDRENTKKKKEREKWLESGNTSDTVGPQIIRAIQDSLGVQRWKVPRDGVYT